MNCESCFYYKEKWHDEGFCRLYPPTVHIVQWTQEGRIKDTTRRTPFTYYPEVKLTDWCGQWKDLITATKAHS